MGFCLCCGGVGLSLLCRRYCFYCRGEDFVFTVVKGFLSLMWWWSCLDCGGGVLVTVVVEFMSLLCRRFCFYYSGGDFVFTVVEEILFLFL
jgi:hypothetical protein